MPTYLPENVGISMSEALAQAYASATAGEPLLFALELHHPTFTVPGRIVNDMRNHTLTLEAGAPVDGGDAVEFIGVPFRYTRPEQVAELKDAGAPAVVAIEIDNVSLAIAEVMLLAKESEEPVTVIAREYLASDTSAPHILPVLTLAMINIDLGVETISAQLTFGDLTNLRFPRRPYTAEQFPGLVA
jgi:hypothetical protein